MQGKKKEKKRKEKKKTADRQLVQLGQGKGQKDGPKDGGNEARGQHLYAGTPAVRQGLGMVVSLRACLACVFFFLVLQERWVQTSAEKVSMVPGRSDPAVKRHSTEVYTRNRKKSLRWVHGQRAGRRE